MSGKALTTKATSTTAPKVTSVRGASDSRRCRVAPTRNYKGAPPGCLPN